MSISIILLSILLETWIAVFKVKLTVKVQNVSECLYIVQLTSVKNTVHYLQHFYQVQMKQLHTANSTTIRIFQQQK